MLQEVYLLGYQKHQAKTALSHFLIPDFPEYFQAVIYSLHPYKNLVFTTQQILF